MDNWYWAVIAVFFIGMAGVQAYEDHTKSECRIEMAKLGKSANDIATICK